MDETNSNPTQPSVQTSQITADQTLAETSPDSTPQSNVPTPTAMVTEPPKPKSKKPLLIVLLILILGIIAGGVYLYLQNQKSAVQPIVPEITQQTPSPTPDPMADWEIYSISPYQVKYPQGLQVREDEGSVLNISKWGPTQTEGTELFDGFSITFQPREISDADLSAYVDAKIEEVKIQDISKVTSGPSPVTLNNYEGLTFVEEGLGIYKVTIVESKEKSMFMEISVLVSDPGNLGFQETVDQILSTFKFIQNDNEALSVENFKKDCIAIRSKDYIEEYIECQESSGDSVYINKLKNLCGKYQGNFTENASTCRHALPNEPCSPEVAAVCSHPTN